MPCPCGLSTYCYRSCSPATQEAYAQLIWSKELEQQLKDDAKDAKEERDGAPYA